MRNRTELTNDIGQLILQCEHIVGQEWDAVTIVYDTSDTHTANSGFLYSGSKVIPIGASIATHPLLVRDTVLEMREIIYRETARKFKQLLIQIESKANRIKIDFEFDDASRWSIKPARIREMREALRPVFDI